MNILTKILVVLLAFCSLFLCGMVVTYVGTADNYKKSYEAERLKASNYQTQFAMKERIAQENAAKNKLQIEKYEQDLQSLQSQVIELNASLNAVNLEKLKEQARADRWQSVMESYWQTISNLETTLKNTQAQLDVSREEGIRNQKELSEITANLYERIVQLQAMEAEKRRFLEQKTELEAKLQQITGTPSPAAVMPVTPEKTAVTSASTLPSGVDLNGLVSEVANNMATISLGSVDGVKENMKFHIVRGDQFISDIIITNVDTNKSAGVLELKLQQPLTGDTVTTRL